MSAPHGNGAAAGDALAPLADARRRCAGAPLGERFSLRFHAQLAERAEQTTQSGEPFLRLRFNDGAADLELRVWRRTTWWDACAALESGAFCEVRGTFVRRQAKYGADPERLEVRPLDATERAAALLGPPARREKLAADLALIGEKIDSLCDPRLQALARRFLGVHGARFRRACAARTYHHARRGGLAEHVAGMMRGAEGICAAYPHLNRDLLLAGVLFHDCGKLWECCPADADLGSPAPTLIGEMLGHITVGGEVVNRLWHDLAADTAAAGWEDLEPSSEHVRLHLLHLILSHHGEMQFGSPVVPKTPEAVALHHLDNLDAKLDMMAGALERAAVVAPGLRERVAPLPGLTAEPLGIFRPADDSGADDAGGLGAPDLLEDFGRAAFFPEPTRHS